MPLERYRATIKIGDVDPPIQPGEIVLLDPTDPMYASYLTGEPPPGRGPLLVPAPEAEPAQPSPAAKAFAEAIVHEPLIAAEVEDEVTAVDSDHDQLDLVAVESDGDVESGDGTDGEDDTDDGLDSVASVGNGDEPLEPDGDAVH